VQGQTYEKRLGAGGLTCHISDRKLGTLWWVPDGKLRAQVAELEAAVEEAEKAGKRHKGRAAAAEEEAARLEEALRQERAAGGRMREQLKQVGRTFGDALRACCGNGSGRRRG
jgi:predicted 2-oxoglutarate/Fe(II)-dependent dioxygenase YbiX